MLGIENLSFEDKLEYASFGGGALFILVALTLYIAGGPDLKTIASSLFIAGILVMFLPYGLYTYFRDRRYSKMEKEFPAFLRNLSESIKSGMSLPEAFQQASRTDYGQLNDEIEKTAHQLSWGIPFPEAMERMSDRMTGSELIRRAIYIVLQSYESGGNISETLDSIAGNAAMIKEAERQKKSVLSQQMYIIYAIHFLFLGIIIGLYMLLSNFLLEMGGGAMSQGLGFGEPTNFCQDTIASAICQICPMFSIGDVTNKLCYYKSLFLIMLMVEGVMNGIVAGEVMESKLSAGIKHSMAMAVIAFFIYILAMSMI